MYWKSTADRRKADGRPVPYPHPGEEEEEEEEEDDEEEEDEDEDNMDFTVEGEEVAEVEDE